MNRELRVIAALLALSVLSAGSAHAAAVVAGWDFSQYRGSNSLDPVASSTLSANYSDSDPTFNAGSGSAAFGTLYFNGSNGSSSTSTAFLPTVGTMNCERRPTGGLLQPVGCQAPNVNGPIRSNKNEPWTQAGDPSFDAFSVLRAEGQQYQNALAMAANDNVSVVFKGDMGGGNSANSWRLSFGAKTFTGVGDNGGPFSCDPDGGSQCTTSVGIEWSTDGVTYNSAGSVQVTSADTRYDVPLYTSGNNPTSQMRFARLNLAPGAGGAAPMIDNVALPEPGATLGLLSGMLVIAALRKLQRS